MEEVGGRPPAPPGSKVTVRLTPTPVPKEQNEAWLASLPTPKAQSYVFAFPFDIYCKANVKPVSVEFEGYTWTLHPPFLADGEPSPRQIDIDAVTPDAQAPAEDPRVSARLDLRMLVPSNA